MSNSDFMIFNYLLLMHRFPQWYIVSFIKIWLIVNLVFISGIKPWEHNSIFNFIISFATDFNLVSSGYFSKYLLLWVSAIRNLITKAFTSTIISSTAKLTHRNTPRHWRECHLKEPLTTSNLGQVPVKPSAINQ